MGTVAAGAVAIAILVAIEPYRLDRMEVFLDPGGAPLGEGYQPRQSLIAVGSGGLVGRGPGESRQRQLFLPQPHSDFVFAILAEEHGLLGALAVVALFGVLVWRGMRAGIRAPDAFGRYAAFGFTGAIAVQALLNVSVALTILPTTGITLPLLSYGGSSLIMTLAGCGVVLNVSQHA
jgi:cell division protein FtsW